MFSVSQMHKNMVLTIIKSCAGEYFVLALVLVLRSFSLAQNSCACACACVASENQA